MRILPGRAVLRYSAVFRDAEGETAFIEELQEALKSKSYAPSPVKRVMIPKADGSQRPLEISTIRDRGETPPDERDGNR